MLYNPITGETRELVSSSETTQPEQPQGEITTPLQQAQDPIAATANISPHPNPCHIDNELTQDPGVSTVLSKPRGVDWLTGNGNDSAHQQNYLLSVTHKNAPADPPSPPSSLSRHPDARDVAQHVPQSFLSATCSDHGPQPPGIRERLVPIDTKVRGTS